MKQSSLSISRSLIPWPALRVAFHRRGSLRARPQSAEEAGGFHARLFFFKCRNRIVQQRRPHAIAGDPIAQVDSADKNAGIDIAVQRQHSHRSAIPAARVFFDFLDGLRRRFLGRPNHGDGPHVRQKCIQRIESWLQNAFHVIDGVEDAGVGFDQPASDHFHRTRNRHARLVVAVDVAAHGQLGLFLGRIQQLADAVGVAQRIARAPRGSGDGAGFHAVAFHSHEHLRRRAHQLLVAELHEKLVRTRAGMLNPLEQLRRAF